MRLSLYPSATDTALGTGKWAADPSAVLARQERGWTYGFLVNHIWSFAGAPNRPEVNLSLVQPFVGYTMRTHTTFGMSSETVHDWGRSQWAVPISLSVAQLLKIGGQPIQFQVGGRYYIERPAGGPDWSLRAVTLLFPK